MSAASGSPSATVLAGRPLAALVSAWLDATDPGSRPNPPPSYEQDDFAVWSQQLAVADARGYLDLDLDALTRGFVIPPFAASPVAETTSGSTLTFGPGSGIGAGMPVSGPGIAPGSTVTGASASGAITIDPVVAGPVATTSLLVFNYSIAPVTASTASACPAGQAALAFGDTTGIAAGLTVLGASLAPGTTVLAATATGVTLSTGVTAEVGAGARIAFAIAPGSTLPAVHGTTAGSCPSGTSLLTFGAATGICAGMTATAAGLPPGTTVLAVTATTVALSQNAAAPIGTGAQVAFGLAGDGPRPSLAATTSQDAASGAQQLTFAETGAISAGMSAFGAGLGPGRTVTDVTATAVTLSSGTAAEVTGGSLITFAFLPSTLADQIAAWLPGTTNPATPQPTVATLKQVTAAQWAGFFTPPGRPQWLPPFTQPIAPGLSSGQAALQAGYVATRVRTFVRAVQQFFTVSTVATTASLPGAGPAATFDLPGYDPIQLAAENMAGFQFGGTLPEGALAAAAQDALPADAAGQAWLVQAMTTINELWQVAGAALAPAPASGTLPPQVSFTFSVAEALYTRRRERRHPERGLHQLGMRLGRTPGLTWAQPAGSALAALLGLAGTGLTAEYASAGGDVVWRDGSAALRGFGPERDRENGPVPTVLPALDTVLDPQQLRFASVHNGFAMKDATGGWLGGAQGFAVTWSGALLIDREGTYEFWGGAPVPGEERPDADAAGCRQWRVVLRRGQRTWVILSHHWAGEEERAATALPLKRGAYELTAQLVQPAPEFRDAEDVRPQHTGLQVKYCGPDSGGRRTEIPHHALFAVRKDSSPAIAGLSAAAAAYQAGRYGSSLRDIRRTYQRIFKALLFCRRLGLSARREPHGTSELGYLLGQPQLFAGAGYYRGDGGFLQHLAYFDLDFLPLRDDYQPPAPGTDARTDPSPQRVQAMFDWWERLFDYAAARADVRRRSGRALWPLFAEAQEKQPAQPGSLLRHLGADARCWPLELRYFDGQNLPVSELTSADLADERWVLRAWHADRWLRDMQDRFAVLDITTARPDLWACDDPSAPLPVQTQTGNGNLVAFVTDGYLAPGAPHRDEDLKRINDGLRDRGRRALIAYLRQQDRVPLPWQPGTFATAAGDLTDLLLLDAVTLPGVLEPSPPSVQYPGGLGSYPFFAYTEPGARLFPASWFPTALTVAGALRARCGYELALRWYRRSFDPLKNDCAWMHCADNTDSERGSDSPGACCDSTQVTEGAARDRAVTLHYARTLIDWADALMRRGHAPEAFQQARVLYDTAARIAGPRPETVLLPEPASAPCVTSFVPAYPPLNPELMRLYDLIADRRGLIRLSLDASRIRNGRPDRDMPYFGPGRREAGSACAEEEQWCGRPSPYRFSVQIAKATELAGRVGELGAALLSAYEKGDAEYLAHVHAEQEREMQALGIAIRQDQWRDADWQLQALQQTKDTNQAHLLYYTGLYQNGLLNNEIQNLDLTMNALMARTGANVVEATGEIMNIIPDPFVGAMSSGASVPAGSKLAHLFEAIGRIMQTVADIQSTTAGMDMTQAGWQRRAAEWIHQMQALPTEIQQIELQILGAHRRRDQALRELNNAQRQVEHSTETLDFLRDKFTATELYLFLQQETAAGYRQMYELARRAADEAMRSFRFELPHVSGWFLAEDDWDSLHAGLLAGERLDLALHRMEQAYLTENRREFELTKHISLRLDFPVAYLQLRTAGYCEISMPEWMFDVDYPGQYLRRFKSLQATAPLVAGPLTGVHCRLTMLSSTTRVSQEIRPPAQHCCGDGREHSGYALCAEDPRMVPEYAARESIATSSGQNDSGLFELSFRDERYLPFEYRGVVSRWRIELPPENNYFDLDTLTDLVLHVNYTAREGGEALRDAALRDVRGRLPGDGLRLFDVRQDFPDAWPALREPGHEPGREPGHQGRRRLRLGFTPAMFPFVPGRPVRTIDRLVLMFAAPGATSGRHHLVRFWPEGAVRDEATELECVAGQGWPGFFYGTIDLRAHPLGPLRQDHPVTCTFEIPAAAGLVRSAFVLASYDAPPARRQD